MLKRGKNAIACALGLLLAVSLYPAAPTDPGTPEYGTSAANPQVQAPAVQDGCAEEAQGAGEGKAAEDSAAREQQGVAGFEAKADAAVIAAAEANDTGRLAEQDADAEQALIAYIDARSYGLASENGDGEAQDAPVVQMSNGVLDALEQRSQGFARMEREANIEVLDARAAVKVEGAELAGDALRVSAVEYTTFTYDDLADGPGGEDTAVFGTSHELLISRAEGGYAIERDAFDETDICGLDTTDWEWEPIGASDEVASQSDDGAAQAVGDQPEAQDTAQEGPLDAAVADDAADAASSIATEADPATPGDDAADEAQENSAQPAEPEAAEAQDLDAQRSGDGASAAPGMQDTPNPSAQPDFAEALADSLSLQQAQAAGVAYDADYDPVAAIEYSNTYALNYNDAYRNFNPLGGDCANFVSQCLVAGGLNQTASWYYRGPQDYETTWTYCPHMVRYFRGQYGEDKTVRAKYVDITKSSAASAAAVYPGSPVLYMGSDVWSHATICVGYNSAGTPVVNAHNNDRYHVPYTYWNPAGRCSLQLTAMNGVSQFTTKSGKTTYIWLVTGNGKVALVDVSGTVSTVKLPSTVTNALGEVFAVDAIEPGALANSAKRSSVKKLVTGDSLTCIGAGALRNCTSLTSVTLGAAVRDIGESAFAGCTALKGIAAGAGTKTVGASAFAQCTALASADLGGVTALGASAFEGCTALAAVSGGAFADVPDRAFYGCKKLAGCSVAASASIIGVNAFRSCKALVLPSALPNLVSTGKDAFRNCDAVTAVPAMPKAVKLGRRAFYDCDGLLSAVLDAPLLATVGQSAFESCGKLQKMSYASTRLKTVSKRAFFACPLLKTAMLPVTCTSVKDSAFEGCASLAKVVGASVTSVRDRALYGCTAYTGASKLPKVKKVGVEAFRNCTSLASITKFTAVKSLGAGAFRGCTRLAKLPAFAKLVEVPKDAFRNCDSIVSLPAFKALVTLGTRAFYGCDSLKSASLKSPVLAKIGTSALASCRALKTVTVKSTVLSKIKAKAFRHCYALSKLTLSTLKLKQAKVGAGAFEGCSALLTVKVPAQKAASYVAWFKACGLPANAAVSA